MLRDGNSSPRRVPGTWITWPEAREILDYDSAAVGDRIRLTVRLGEPNAPTAFVLDPVFLFDLAVGAAAFLHTAGRFTGTPFPDLTIVGVGYPTDDVGSIWKSRSRDLTPTAGDATRAVRLPALDFGGASHFLDALGDEIFPILEERFDIPSDRRVLCGFSFGGLFALYCLFHRPELFDGYLIGSPSLWWDDGIVLQWERAWANHHVDLAAKIVLTSGECEQNECGYPEGTWKNEGFSPEALRQIAQVDRLRALDAQLRSRRYPSLDLTTAVFEDEFHLTAPPAMFGRGFVSLFEGAPHG